MFFALERGDYMKNTEDFLLDMCEGNIGALKVIMDIVAEPDGILDILLLKGLDIKGYKIGMLYKDCCACDMDKFNFTLKVLASGAYTYEDIQTNFALVKALPFTDDSVSIPTDMEEFDFTHELWKDYVLKNKEVVAPRIYEAYKGQKGTAKMLQK